MPDREETLLPLTGWADVHEQLSLPLRVYRRQLMRTCEPARHIMEQVGQACGGWLRLWQQSVHSQRLAVIEGFRLLDRQLNLLDTIVGRCQEEMCGMRKQAED